MLSSTNVTSGKEDDKIKPSHEDRSETEPMKVSSKSDQSVAVISKEGEKREPTREDEGDTEAMKSFPKRNRSVDDDLLSSPPSKHPRMEHVIIGTKGIKADMGINVGTKAPSNVASNLKDNVSDRSTGALSNVDEHQTAVSISEDILDRKISVDDVIMGTKGIKADMDINVGTKALSKVASSPKDNVSDSTSRGSSGALSEVEESQTAISISEDILDRKISDSNLETLAAQAASSKREASASKPRTYTFPEKMMHLLDSKEEKESLCWLPDGRSFAIIPGNFAQKVLPKYFDGTKFESFTRKLNRWGFKRVTDDEDAPGTFTYHHPLFRRGLPSLCRWMSGGKKPDNPAGTLSDAQVHSLQLMQGQSAPPDSALMASLLGGAALEGFPLTLGANASLMMSPTHPRLPGAGVHSGATQGGAPTGLEIRQELLRLEAVRKKQEELAFQQELGELIRRKAEEERVQQLLQAFQPSASGISPQVLAELMMRRSARNALSVEPTGLFPGQVRSPSLPPAATAASFPSSLSLPAAASLSGSSALMEEFAEFLRLKTQKSQQGRQDLDYARLVQEDMERKLRAHEDRTQSQQGRQDPDYHCLVNEAMARRLRTQEEREQSQQGRQDPYFQRLVQKEISRQLRARGERDSRFR